MCGIAVILTGAELDVPPFTIDRMTAALRHRGPDAQQTLRLRGCHLGHTRLSIIDPANGAQPMTDPSGRWTIVFNGEIYNHRELRRELERDGVTFRTHCDTEVLLLGYATWGRSVLSRLNGQFAFAIWDAVEHSLFVARDRFGEKPLYWARSPAGHVLLASEIKSILASGLLRPRLDLDSIDAYLGLYYIPPDRSVYENVHPLPPAHAAVWHADGRCDRWRYWAPRYSCHDVDEREAVPHVRQLLTRAVERQTVADVPVGAFLSGGLDSTTIVAFMSQSGGAPKTFAVGFADLIDELPFARDAANAYRTEHHELQTDIDVAGMLHRMTDVYDEPFGDSSNIPTFLVSEYARQSVKVVLSGDGGDEIFGGYDWYRGLLDGAIGATGAQVWKCHVASSTGVFHDRATLWGGRGRFDAGPALRGSHPAPEGSAGMDGAAAFDVSCYLPGDILAKVDRAAMAHGLETRCPFLDVELAEFVLGLPWPMRFGGGRLKHLLRAACQDLWPQSIGRRGKQGFGAPVRHWLEQPPVTELWRRVSAKNSPLVALLPGLPSISDELRPQRRWSLLCLGLWLERNDVCLASPS